MSTKFVGLAVASIQAGRQIAEVVDFIIDPHKLVVIAFYVQRQDDETEYVLFVEDITDISVHGLVIDHDDLLMTNDDDLVRLKEITDLNFYLVDKSVETESGSKVGTVARFALNTSDFSIVQLYVAQPVTLNLRTAEVIIHRKQIVNVTDKKIVVKDTSVKTAAKFGIRGLLFGRTSTAKADMKRAKPRRTKS